MKLRKYILIILISFSFFLAACGNRETSTSADVAFRNFTLSLFQSEVSSNTINLHYTLKSPASYGIPTTPITMGSFDFNQPATLAYFENLQSALDSFDREALSEENQLTYDILSYYIECEKKGASYYLYREPLSPLTGIHAQLPILLAEYQFYTLEDAENYLNLLETVPDYFDSLIRFEKEKTYERLFMFSDVVAKVLEQCDDFLSSKEDHFLLTTFQDRLGSLSDDVAKVNYNLVERNEIVFQNKVIPSYQRLKNALSDMQNSGINDKGLCYFPDGREYYLYLLQSSVGTSRSPQELQVMIQKQLRTDLADLEKTLTDHPSVFDNSSMINMTPTEILEMLSEKINTAFPPAPDTQVEIKSVPSSLEEHVSPAFYLTPPLDSYMENTIYINERYEQNNLSLFTTLAHEGYPGHLYQNTYYASTNPDPLRIWLNFPGYSEGWATYVEMCSYYLAPIDKNLATILQKNNSILLGLYALADLGIHYEGWTREETIAFFSDYGITDTETIEELYSIILGDPANYLNYHVGYLEILELKKNFQGSQLEFHKKLLETGPAPFKILKHHLLKQK